MASANGGGMRLAPGRAQVYTCTDEVGRTLRVRKSGSLALILMPAAHATLAAPALGPTLGQ